MEKNIKHASISAGFIVIGLINCTNYCFIIGMQNLDSIPKNLLPEELIYLIQLTSHCGISVWVKTWQYC